MVYLEPKEIKRLKKFSADHKVPMTQVVREAVNARLTVGDAFTNGFNTGIDKAVSAVKSTQWAQMRFPSGRSIAELIDDDLSSLKMEFFDQ
jgi:hypothetical protein